MENLKEVFKPNSLKLTPQRIAVYEMLKNTKSHPCVETIYNNIKDRFPTMSLATVYKTVKTLVAVGLAQELNVGEGNFRYDANALPHPHIVCQNCGRVDDIEDMDLSFLNQTAEDHSDYSVSHNHVYFYGLCPECK